MLLRDALGRSVRERRTLEQLTLRQVAARSAIALGYLSEVERGTKEISSELLDALAGALSTTVAELMRDTCALLEQPIGQPLGRPHAPHPDAAPVALARVDVLSGEDDEQPWPLREPAPAGSWSASPAA